MTDIELLSKRARQKAARAEAGFFDHPAVESITRSIDHTLLCPSPTSDEIAAHCEEALKYNFASVCIPMTAIKEACRILKGSNVNVGTIASFPLGASPVSIKTAEILWALEHGANEVDVTLDISAIKEGNRESVRDELLALREAASGNALKVTIEMPLLSEIQIITTLGLIEQAGIDFVRTCTGFGNTVTFYHVALLRTAASSSLKIKAEGGIKTFAAAEILKALGADRLGTSMALNFLKL